MSRNNRNLELRYFVTFTPDFKAWPRKTVLRAMEETNLLIAKMWSRDFLKKHFTRLGGLEYRYQARGRAYRRRKLRRAKGVTGPLIGIKRKGHPGGRLKREVMGTRLLRSTRRKIQVTMNAPAYVGFRGKGGTGPDMVKELTTVSRKELILISRLYGERMAKALENEPRKKRIRG